MGGGASKRKKKGDGDEDSDDEGEVKGGYFGSVWREEYVDPPLPDWPGKKPVGYLEIESRTRSIKFAMRQMMKVVMKHANDSVESGRTIPVSRQLERVQVTEVITKLIMSRQGRREDVLWVRDNLTEIQGDLAIRRAAIKMLNHNYSDVVVCKLDPIQTDEARTVQKPKDVLHPDEETKSPSRSPTKK